MIAYESRLAFGVERHKIRGRTSLSTGVVLPLGDMRHEAIQKQTRSSHVRAADASRGQRAPNGINCNIMQSIEFFRCALPVDGKIGLIPDLEIPALHFCVAVALEAVCDPVENEITPLSVILRRIGHAFTDAAIVESRTPVAA